MDEEIKEEEKEEKSYGWLWALVLILLALVLGYLLFMRRAEPVEEGFTFDYKNSTFLIDGKFVTLKNGIAEEPVAPGSATMAVTRFFGNEVEADVDNDGDTDAAFIVTHNPGGSGTFYYVVGAIKQDNGYHGTSGVLLGDRIAPQTTEFRDGLVIVNYADRAPGEPMVADPSVGKSMYLKYDTEEQVFDQVTL